MHQSSLLIYPFYIVIDMVSETKDIGKDGQDNTAGRKWKGMRGIEEAGVYEGEIADFVATL